MQNLRGFRDALLENAERRGIGDHERRDIAIDDLPQLLDIDLAARVRANIFHFVAGDHRGGRIGAVRRIRDQNFLARIALALQISANQEQPGQFTLRAGAGLECHRVHAGDFEQAVLQDLENFQAALRKLDGLIGMLGGDAVQTRDVLVHARVVLHGAGAERIHAEVDREIPSGEAREVADHLDFTDFGEAGYFRRERCAPRACFAFTAGTSSGGNSKPRFPGADFSKISPSFWLTWRLAFLMRSVTANPLV